MAKALCVKKDNEIVGRYAGDIITIKDDDHIFSNTELELGNVMRISGTADDVLRKLNSLAPEKRIAVRWISDGKYHLDPPEDPEDDIDDEKEVFRVGNSFYELKEDFSCRLNMDQLAAEDKQALEDTNIKSKDVDTIAAKLVKDLSKLPGNDKEVADLKITQEPADEKVLKS